MATEQLLWTWLRHAMLRAIRDGRVLRGLDPAGWWVIGREPSHHGYVIRAVDALIDARFARLAPRKAGRPRHETPVQLTAAGEACLSVWDAEHPEVTSGS